MDVFSNSMVLNGGLGDGLISNGTGTVIGLFLKSALTGTLTIGGVTQSDGSAQSWVNAPGTNGYVAPPGSKKFWSPFFYTLSNPGADAGKAVMCWVPT